MKIFKRFDFSCQKKNYFFSFQRRCFSDESKIEHLFGILPVLSSLKSKKRDLHRLFIKKSKEEKDKKGKSNLLNEIIQIAKQENLPLFYLDRDEMDSMRPKSNKNTSFNHQGNSHI